MKVITILFTYNRPLHTRKTLKALEENTICPDELWVFQDGPKEDKDENWFEVNKIVKSINWCNCRAIIGEKNQGLGKSIVNGINKAFEEADAVIVLEDDCVSHPLFLEFMNEALEKYANQERVFQINGNAYPIKLKKDGYDAFFTPRVDCWGWGTWKEKWKYMSLDYTILKRIKNNEHSNYLLENYGRDLEGYMINTLYSKSNSWACFWGMTVFEHDGLCLSVYESLIENVGFDSSGTNSSIEIEIEQLLRPLDNLNKLLLPDEIKENEEIKEYLKEYSSWTSKENRLEIYNNALVKIACLYQDKSDFYTLFKEHNIKNIAIYGMGQIADIIINELEPYSMIDSIILSKKEKNKKEYRGIEIVQAKDAKKYDLVIVIPEFDVEFIRKKITTSPVMGVNEILDSWKY